MYYIYWMNQWNFFFISVSIQDISHECLIRVLNELADFYNFHEHLLSIWSNTLTSDLYSEQNAQSFSHRVLKKWCDLKSSSIICSFEYITEDADQIPYWALTKSEEAEKWNYDSKQTLQHQLLCHNMLLSINTWCRILSIMEYSICGWKEYKIITHFL